MPGNRRLPKTRTADVLTYRRPTATGLARAVARQQGVQHLGLVASGAAFWLVISSLPTAVAVVTLYGLVVDPAQVARDLGNLANRAPASLGALVDTQLQRVAASDPRGLTIGLLISVVLAVWAASAGIYNLDRAIRDAYGLPRQRYVDTRLRSFAEAAAAVVALGAIALTTAAILGDARGAVALAIGVPSVFVVVVTAVTGLYRFAAARPVPLRALLPGSMTAAAGMMFVLVAFGAYASVSTHFTAVYGVFGAAVIGMIATYLAVYATLLGALLNAELSRRDDATGILNDS